MFSGILVLSLLKLLLDSRRSICLENNHQKYSCKCNDSWYCRNLRLKTGYSCIHIFCNPCQWCTTCNSSTRNRLSNLPSGLYRRCKSSWNRKAWSYAYMFLPCRFYSYNCRFRRFESRCTWKNRSRCSKWCRFCCSTESPRFCTGTSSWKPWSCRCSSAPGQDPVWVWGWVSAPVPVHNKKNHTSIPGMAQDQVRGPVQAGCRFCIWTGNPHKWYIPDCRSLPPYAGGSCHRRLCGSCRRNHRLYNKNHTGNCCQTCRTAYRLSAYKYCGRMRTILRTGHSDYWYLL